MVGPYRLRVWGVLVIVAAATTACRGDHGATLSDIQGVEVLRQQFNADAGKPRIVLLLSPT